MKDNAKIIIQAIPDGYAHDEVISDPITNVLVGIGSDHHEIHEGDSYFCLYSAQVNTDGVVSVRIGTPNTEKRAHMVFDISAALACKAELWVDTTMTDNVSNRITPINRDFDSANTSGLTICHTPSGSQTGSANLLQYIGSSGVRTIVGGDTRSRNEFILGRNSAYYIKVTSLVDNNSISIVMDWYMLRPKR